MLKLQTPVLQLSKNNTLQLQKLLYKGKVSAEDV